MTNWSIYIIIVLQGIRTCTWHRLPLLCSGWTVYPPADSFEMKLDKLKTSEQFESCSSPHALHTAELEGAPRSAQL